MALRISRNRLDELNAAKQQGQLKLAQAYQGLGGSDTALTPNYAANNPAPTASIPTLEKAVVSTYENLDTKPTASEVLSLRGFMQGNEQRNAQQEYAPLYNEIKNRQTENALQRLGQLDSARSNNSALVQDIARTGGSYNPADYNSIGDYLLNAPYSSLSVITNGIQDALAASQRRTADKPWYQSSPLDVLGSAIADRVGINQPTISPEMEALGFTQADLDRWNNAQNEEERQNVLTDWARNHRVASTINAVPENAFGSIAGTVDKVKNYLSGNAMESSPTNADIYRQTVADTIDNKYGRFAYNVGNSLADMLFATLLTAPLGGIGGGANAARTGARAAAAIMGAEKANQVGNEAIERGLNPNQIMSEMVGSGVTTALTEALPLEGIVRGSSIWRNILSEGLQEGAEDLADTALDQLVTALGGNHDKAELSQTYREYREAGYSTNEALKQTALSYGGQVLLDMLAGGISGGIMGAGSNVVQGRNPLTGRIPSLNENTEEVAEAQPDAFDAVADELVSERDAVIEAIRNNDPNAQELVDNFGEKLQSIQDENPDREGYVASLWEAVENAANETVNETAENIPTVNPEPEAETQPVQTLQSTVDNARTLVDTFVNSGNYTLEGLQNLRTELTNLVNADPENAQTINQIWNDAVQTIQERTQQTETVQEEPAKPTIRKRTLNEVSRIAESLKNKLLDFNADESYIDRVNEAAERVANEQTQEAVDNFNSLVDEINEAMKDSEITVTKRELTEDLRKVVKDITDDYTIRVTDNMLKNELRLKTMDELNSSTFLGDRNHRITFRKNSGSPIDTVYAEMYERSQGLLPPPEELLSPENMLVALYDLIQSARTDKRDVETLTTWDRESGDRRTQEIVDFENRLDDALDKIEDGELTLEEYENLYNEANSLFKKYSGEDRTRLVQDFLNLRSAYQENERVANASVRDSDINDAESFDDLNDILDEMYDEDLDAEEVTGEIPYEHNQSSGVHTGRYKFSKAFTNTGSKIMTDQQIRQAREDNNMLYEENSEQESMDEAYDRLAKRGYQSETERLMHKDSFTNVDVDELMILWKQSTENAQALEEAGLDADEAWKYSVDLFEKVKEQTSKAGQSLQAFAKWSRNCTPQGLLTDAISIIQKAQEGYNAAKKGNWNKEVQKATKPADKLDADFFKRFMREANNLYDGNWVNMKNVTDGYTIKVNNALIKAIGLESIKQLNNDTNTETTRSIKFVNSNGENVTPLNVAYEQIAQKAGLPDPANMTEADMLKAIYDYVTENNNRIDMDSREARETMAHLGAMVNEQIPPTIAEKVTSLLMDNMLGNFRTLITRNAGGNIGFNVVEQLLKKPLAAFIDQQVAKKTGIRTTAGLSREGMNAWVEGFKEGLAQEVYDFQNDIHSARSGENTLKTATGNNRQVFNNKLLQKYDKLVKTGLSIGDRPFYEAVYKQSMLEYNRMYEQGLLDKTYTNAEGEQITYHLDRDTFNKLAELHAKTNALAAVYQDDTALSEAFVGMKKAIGEMSEGLVGSDILSQFSMPFVKTPANIIERSIEYSPLGFAKNAVQTIRELRHVRNKTGDAKLDFDQERFVNELSRNIIGTALFAIGVAMANAGGLTGAYSDDKDMRQAQKEAGMQEYALDTPIGDFDISWVPVLGNNLVSAASAYDAWKRSDTGGVQALGNGLTSGVGSLFDASMLQGLQRLVGGSGSFGNDEGDIVANMKDTLLSGMTQFVPSLARQFAAATDDYSRQLSGPNQDDYYRNSVINAIPFLRQTLEPKISRTGEEIEQNAGQGTFGQWISNFISPATWTVGSEDPVRDEAMRLFESTGNNIAFEPAVTMNELKYEGHVPTAQEYTEYQRNAYGAMNRIAQTVINSDIYAEMTDGERESVLADIYSAIKSVEKANILGLDDNNFSGAARAYYEGGDQGLIDYVTARNYLSQMGMSNSASNREYILDALNEGGAEAVTQMVEQSQELAAAGLNTNMQYKYDHATNYIPALTPTEFADTWNAINTDGNSSIKQDEVLAYLNQNPSSYTDSQALALWNAYGSNWAYVPYYDEETGLWKKRK